MKIAVLLATYNGAEFVSEQIASILCQSHADLTLFIRDDGSSDATVEVCLQAARRDGRITLLPYDQRPSGSAAANFFKMLCATDLAGFDYVAFSDQDDIWAPGKLARAVYCLREHRAEGYSSDLVAFDNEAGSAWYVRKSASMRQLDYLFQGASAGCTYLLSRKAALFVKEKFELAGCAFPATYSHDWLIYAMCRSHGLSWHIDAQSHIFYRQHARNAYGALPGARGFLIKLKLSGAGWYRDHVLWNAQFLNLSAAEQSVLKLVQRLGLLDRVKLAWQADQFRRSRRDKFFFQVALLLGRF